MISLCEISVSHKPQRNPRCPKILGSSCDVEKVNRGLIFCFFLARAKASACVAHLQSSVFKLSKDLIDSIHEEGIVAYTS